jgi:septum formation protein
MDFVMTLILASSSPYRRALLQRLGLPFECVTPALKESAAPGEQAAAMALRLAQEKAAAVAQARPEDLVIGSDQVACLDGRIVTKPGTHARALAQLEMSSGRQLNFYTGLSVQYQGTTKSCVEQFSVVFRELSHDEINTYLEREQPYDCAGSFKWEGLGISLFQRLVGDDPTALEGLPLIRLCAMLRDFGLDPLGPRNAFKP